MPILTIAVAFSAVAKKNEGLLSILAEELPKYGIDTPLRICHFLSQLSHESAGFTIMQENLNYSSEGLLKIFKRYFSPELAKHYQRKPQMIANKVYANRMGNGGESSGDGWKYRGRGFIQLTGKSNYIKYSKLVFRDDRLVTNPDLATDLKTACLIACEFWKENSLNTLADKDDVHSITKKINGGLNGIEHRKELLAKAKQAIGV